MRLKKSSFSVLLAMSCAIFCTSSLASGVAAIQITGVGAAACSLQVSGIDIGNIVSGRKAALDIPIGVNVSCIVPWSLTASSVNYPLRIGDTPPEANSMSVMRSNGLASSGSLVNIALAPFTGEGSTTDSNVPLVLRATESSRGGSPVGVGPLAVSVALSLIY